MSENDLEDRGALAPAGAGEASEMPTIWEDPACKGYPCFERPMTPAECKQMIDRLSDRVTELEATTCNDSLQVGGRRWRHLKRGTEYTEIGRAQLQVASSDPVEGSELVIYRGDDGKLWARETGEFEDGRFEPLPTPPVKQSLTTEDVEYPVGTVVHHSSEEDGPADVGLALQLPGGSQLWFGEISRRLWEYAGPDAAELGSDGGWWIILYSGDDTSVIGKCGDAEAARVLADHLAVALAKSPTAGGEE